MITLSQIRGHRNSAVKSDEGTVELQNLFAQIRRERHPPYLTEKDFDKVLLWKLGGQYWRSHALRGANTDEIIRAVTGLALTITHPDKDYEMELRVGVLCTLRGVGVPVASTVLSFAYPEEYAVIDFRSWRQVFPDKQPMFSIQGYKNYMREIRRLARKLGWTAQETDWAIWEHDKTS